MPKDIFLPPLDAIDILPCILIVGSTQSGKSYIAKLILDLINPKLRDHLGVIVVGADKTKSDKYEEIAKEFNTVFEPRISNSSMKQVEDIADKQLSNAALIVNIWDDFFDVKHTHLRDIGSFVTYFRHHQFILILQSHVLSNAQFPTTIRNNSNMIIISRQANKDLKMFEEIVVNSVVTQEQFNDVMQQTKNLPFCFLCYCNFTNLKGLMVISESKFIEPEIS